LPRREIRSKPLLEGNHSIALKENRNYA
jgi:hypothetical protein